MKSKVSSFLFAVLLFSGILAADRVLKIWIRQMLQPGETLLETPLVSVIYVRNYGGAFGILAGNTVLLLLMGLLLLTGLLVWLLRSPEMLEKRFVLPAAVSVCGGAAGNLWDRLADGYVTDFIYLNCIHFPVFNLADVMITLGCAVLLVSLIPGGKEEA